MPQKAGRRRESRATARPARRSARELIVRLEQLAGRFSREAAAQKRELLSALADRPVRPPALLKRLHEALGYLQAYPDDARVLEAVDAALTGFAGRVGELAHDDPDALEKLHDTGIAGTNIYYVFSYPIVRELIRAFPEHVCIARDEFEDTERLDELLRLFITYVENDALDDTEADQWAWLERATAGHRGSDVHWLVERLERAPWPEAVRQRLFNTLNLWVQWRLDARSVSRTLARLDTSRIAFQRQPLRRRSKDLARALRRPTPLRLLDEQQGARLIRTALLASALRHREVYSFTYGNPAEVYVGEPGGELQIVFIGVRPAYRFPLESTFGQLVIKNGVPIGYGYHTILFDRIETGINIYDTWRGAEAAYIYERTLAALHQFFGVRRFLVHRYQIGEDNEEATQSGSYWFYYKLGFRPMDPQVAELTGQELERIRKSPAYRSSPRTLRRLARTDMYFGLGGADLSSYRDLHLGGLALRVTDYVNRAFGGDRAAAERTCASEVAQALNVSLWTKWPEAQRRAYMRLSVPVSMISDLADWPGADKAELRELMRAKGAPQEADYVLLMSRHERLRQAYAALVDASPT